ncbi:permease [Modicisalibacter tunisiensis]|uniref:Permease n=1 Tax=Modicisalibacter tunisiensis TaxID=390637 RepID=A0ABS7X3B5_9GAMM|nr:permease [Modicisalibacter tunisiensis]MBZ9537972.1 permease [Modicisalibacter tunisiensis]MBZ9568611.1 permease [Modicisalibacter tunisiensis]
MFWIFTSLADFLVYSVLGLVPGSRLGGAVHFFVEDVTKIFFLLVVMIYVISLARASLNVEKIRNYLAGNNKYLGYVLGSTFGAITPFCSCSSIPIFLGFTSAGIPIGITMSFLLTSPLINEVAVLLLFSLVGWEITLIYVLTGMLIGVFGGMFLDLVRAERLLQPFALKAYQTAGAPGVEPGDGSRISLKERHEFAKMELLGILGRVWKWVFIGVGLGAALHGFVPEAWFESNLGSGQWWSVPLAVLVGIPLYSNSTGIIPVMESLIMKGLPLGTTLAFCMSTVAASFPEFILLKQVMTWKLLAIIFAILLMSFTIIGWVVNIVYVI